MSQSGRQISSLFNRSGFVDAPVTINEVASELLTVPFMTERLCQDLVEVAESSGCFGIHPTDPVPAVELSLRHLSQIFFDQIQDELGRKFWPMLQRHWPLIEFFGLQDAFIVKYHNEGQTELRLHHDLSQLSGSVKLNNDYSGAELEFPRQGYSNIDVPVGTLLVWPSLVTHPHRSTQLTSGVKYSLTLWFELPLQLS